MTKKLMLAHWWGTLIVPVIIILVVMYFVHWKPRAHFNSLAEIGEVTVVDGDGDPLCFVTDSNRLAAENAMPSRRFVVRDMSRIEVCFEKGW